MQPAIEVQHRENQVHICIQTPLCSIALRSDHSQAELVPSRSLDFRLRHQGLGYVYEGLWQIVGTEISRPCGQC